MIIASRVWSYVHKIGKFSNHKSTHVTHEHTLSHISKIQFQKEMIGVCHLFNLRMHLSQHFFVVEIFTRFLLKIEQITYHSYTQARTHGEQLDACRRFRHIL